MKVPKEIEPNEIRITIWNGCIDSVERGDDLRQDALVRIVKYDKNGFGDNDMDIDASGQECLVREW